MRCNLEDLAFLAAVLDDGSSVLNRARTLSFDFTQGDIRSTRGGVTPTATRATTKGIIDWEGRYRTILSGEVPFDGQRRARNLLTTPENAAAWTSGNGGTGSLGVVTPNFAAAPDGTNTATRLQFALNGGVAAGDTSTAGLGSAAVPVVTGAKSVWVKSNDGTTKQFLLVQGGAGAADLVTASPVWRRVAVVNANLNGWTIGLRGNIVASGGADSIDVLFWHPQWEDVSGQSNQNPSEYVSVGVLASPYHGANVDGVKYFRTLNGNFVTGNVVTEAAGEAIPLAGIGHGWLPGVAGSYFSAPSAAANQIVGDLDIRVKVALDDWTPAAISSLLAKWQVAGNDAYRLFQNTSGGPTLRWTEDGTTQKIATATATINAADGTVKWVRATLDVDNGAGGNDVKFYTADDAAGETWTQLGVTITTAGVTSIFPGNSILEVGSDSGGGGNIAKGTFYRAQVFNGINGVKVVDFTPTAWTAGANFNSSTTGEQWTLNGGAKVNKWPVMGYFPEAQSTNLVLQSEDHSTTWVAIGTPTRVAAALRCGIIKLDLIGDDDAVALEGYSQAVTFTGDAVKAISVFFAQGTSASSVIRLRDDTVPANRMIAVVTWANGLPTITMTGGTLLGLDTDGNGVFRARLQSTAVTALNAHSVHVYPASDNAFAVANVGTAYFGGWEAENATFCSSYIPTTTATVTRNKDDLSLAALGAWFNPNVGTFVSRFVNGTTGGNVKLWTISDGTANERDTVFINAATPNYLVVDGGVSQVALTTAVYAANQVGCFGVCYNLNDFEFYADGVRSGAGDQVGTLPTPTRLDIGEDHALASQLCGGLRTLDYYNQRLPNATLQALTI